ncbi:MAG: nitrilase-related carbon-nitrogen hydrolase [Thermosulfidibacteraceae bacterium]|jgi:predicted amidohydrolase
MEVLKVGIFQAEIGHNIERRREDSLQAIEESKGLDLLCFPEMWLTGFKVDDVTIRFAENFLNEVIELSKGMETTIVLGTLPERKGRKVYNTSFIIKNGLIIAKRRKYFLFEPMGEKELYEKGEMPQAIKIDGRLTLGVIICYELRFPELTKLLSINGCNIVVCTAQWPQDREDHWKLLLRARAVESQTFMIGVNVVGENKNYKFNGYSAVVGPYGNPFIEISKVSGLYKVKIDLEEVDRYRKYVPVIRDSLLDGRQVWKGF